MTNWPKMTWTSRWLMVLTLVYDLELIFAFSSREHFSRVLLPPSVLFFSVLFFSTPPLFVTVVHGDRWGIGLAAVMRAMAVLVGATPLLDGHAPLLPPIALSLALLPMFLYLKIWNSVQVPLNHEPEISSEISPKISSETVDSQRKSTVTVRPICRVTQGGKRLFFIAQVYELFGPYLTSVMLTLLVWYISPPILAAATPHRVSDGAIGAFFLLVLMLKLTLESDAIHRVWVDRDRRGVRFLLGLRILFIVLIMVSLIGERTAMNPVQCVCLIVFFQMSLVLPTMLYLIAFLKVEKKETETDVQPAE